MNRPNLLNRFTLLVVACGTAALLCQLTLTSAHALPPKSKDTKEPTTTGKPPRPPQPPTDPNAWSGFSNGKLALVLHSALPQVPGPKGGVSRYQQAGATIDLQVAFAKLWNDNRAGFEPQLKQLAASRLHDIRVTLAPASPSSKLYMAISPKSKRITLRYAIPHHQITGRVDLTLLPDPSVRVTFDLEMVLVIDTNGPASDPLVLRSASVAVRNADVHVNANFIVDALNSLREFFGGADFANQVERKLNSTNADIRNKLALPIAGLNLKLRPYTLDRGFRLVTPRHTIPGFQSQADLLIEMAQQPLAVQQNTKK